MKKLLTFVFLMSAFIAFAAEKATEVFTLEHQMSSMCEKKRKENLRFEKGISNIEVSLPDNTITITFDPKKTDTEKIIAGFKKIGFTAFLYAPESQAEEECIPAPACCTENPSEEDPVPSCCGGPCCSELQQ